MSRLQVADEWHRLGKHDHLFFDLCYFLRDVFWRRPRAFVARPAWGLCLTSPAEAWQVIQRIGSDAGATGLSHDAAEVDAPAPDLGLNVHEYLLTNFHLLCLPSAVSPFLSQLHA